MRRILVTGANKGIGLAIAEGALREHDDTYLFLGSRDADRGRAALQSLTNGDAALADRAQVVAVDVTDEGSVAAAATQVTEACGDEPLYGLVNNAGVGFGVPMPRVLEVNTRGVERVCRTFLPLLDPEGGRIVNVTSAAGPSFVEKCSAERQAFFTNPETTWPELVALMDECVAIEGDAAAFAERGLGDGVAYGLSKACANTYTIHLAATHPNLSINACTPGFIATDLTLPIAEQQGKDPAEMGMKTPAEGARCPLFLLFGELEGTGRYYGSDAKRSPLDRYRSPGSPAYTGN